MLSSRASVPDPRLKSLLGSLTRQLHDFVREARPSIEEWSSAIDFLTQAGQTCTEARQEFILLSGVLGVSMLVGTINGQDAGTESPCSVRST